MAPFSEIFRHLPKGFADVPLPSKVDRHLPERIDEFGKNTKEKKRDKNWKPKQRTNRGGGGSVQPDRQSTRQRNHRRNNRSIGH